jgi:hypothetical protein
MANDEQGGSGRAVAVNSGLVDRHLPDTLSATQSTLLGAAEGGLRRTRPAEERLLGSSALRLLAVSELALPVDWFGATYRLSSGDDLECRCQFPAEPHAARSCLARKKALR